eukprot:NODE_3596_length_873_cov_25.473190_g3574_i0.p2 GENE.NODE_3596_length_873_cov_25.473190_g3574_i0~~NODE_3596_length_873_cov_25.473190_g3574_i0.p2  ORF type:complete len:271 (-),score=65.94 NODE_3596_length_873_cov_25.473190_g3574_i0:60-773(-)
MAVSSQETDALLLSELGVRHESHWPLSTDQLAMLRRLFASFARGGGATADDRHATDDDDDDRDVDVSLITPADLRRVLASAGVFVSRKRCARAIQRFALPPPSPSAVRSSSSAAAAAAAKLARPRDANGRLVIALTFRDFLVFYSTQIVPMASAAEIKDTFRMLDADGVGRVPAALLFRVFKKLARPDKFTSERHKKRWAQEIKGVFKDGFPHRKPWHDFIQHGFITYDEYVHFMTH